MAQRLWSSSRCTQMVLVYVLLTCGITEHVPYENSNSNYDAAADEMFKVA
jgi:hypothetical protein